VLAFASSVLAADVSITAANTPTDVLSLSLAAGTWLVWAQLQMDPAVNCQATIRLFEGSTVHGSANANTSQVWSLTVMAVIVLSATTTVKVQAENNAASGHVRAAAVINGQGNNATQLIAVQLA